MLLDHRRSKPSKLGANVNVEVAAGYFRERCQGNQDTKQYPTLLHTLTLLSSKDQSPFFHVTVVELLTNNPERYFGIPLGCSNSTQTSKQQGGGGATPQV